MQGPIFTQFNAKPSRNIVSQSVCKHRACVPACLEYYSMYIKKIQLHEKDGDDDDDDGVRLKISHDTKPKHRTSETIV